MLGEWLTSSASNSCRILVKVGVAAEDDHVVVSDELELGEVGGGLHEDVGAAFAEVGEEEEFVVIDAPAHGSDDFAGGEPRGEVFRGGEVAPDEDPDIDPALVGGHEFIAHNWGQ